MKTRRTQIISLIATIILVVGFVLVPGEAKGSIGSIVGSAVGNTLGSVTGIPALGTIFGFGGPSTVAGVAGAVAKSVGICTGVTDCINGALIVLSNLALRISNLLLVLSGTLLNAVMIITLNMATLMGGSNNIIDATWSTIRDLASIIIIFFLLYESIKIIIGVSDSKVKHIIVMVAIAGILLNFSLFFAKMGVDASNLVGLAFYRAIAPSGANLDLSTYTASSTSNFLTSTLTSGGISDEFMRALKIQTADAYQTGSTDPLTIIQSALYGTVLQLIAAFVFLAAAFLFIIRVGLLIVLLVFSPFYFIGLIVPKVEEKISKPWLDMIINQCLILPIFMFFMYIAMRVITNPGFQSIINPAAGSTLLQGTAAATIGMFMQYFIAITLICISLFAALKYASVGKDFVNSSIKTAKKWGSGAVSGTAGFAGRNTVGMAATKLHESEGFRKFAADKPILGGIASKALGGVGSASFGGKKGGFTGARKEADKKNKALFEHIGKVDRANFAEGDEGDRLYNEAKKTAHIAQADYLLNLRKNSVFATITGNAENNQRSSYGMAGGKEGKDLSEKLEKQKAKEVKKLSTPELQEYASSKDASGKFQPPPIPGTKGNKLDAQGELGQQIQQINKRIGILARKTEEDKVQEKFDKAAKDALEAANKDADANKGRPGGKSEPSGDKKPS